MEARKFERLFDFELKKFGFKRRSSHWYLKTSGALQVINLQKSRFGDIFYINLSFVPDGMSVAGLPFPREYKCPIRIRLGTGMSEAEDAYIKEILDLESEISECDREFGIKIIAQNYILPIVINIIDAESIKKALIYSPMKGMIVNREGLEFLGIFSNRSSDK